MKKKIIMLLSVLMLFIIARPVHAQILTSPKIERVWTNEQAPGGIGIGWERVDDADYYKLYVKANGKWKFLCNPRDCLITPYSSCVFINDIECWGGGYFTLAVTAVNEDGESPIDENGQTFAIILDGGFDANITSEGILLTWEPCAHATGYNVYRNGILYQTIDDGSCRSFLDTNVEEGKIYVYHITPFSSIAQFNDDCWNCYRNITYFTAPKLSSVKSSKKSVTVRWKRVSGPQYYQVCYQQAGKKAKKVMVKDDKSFCKISKLKKGKKYKIKVRGAVKYYGGYYYGVWSNTKTIKVK